jgi:hypothetical protein
LSFLLSPPTGSADSDYQNVCSSSSSSDNQLHLLACAQPTLLAEALSWQESSAQEMRLRCLHLKSIVAPVHKEGDETDCNNYITAIDFMQNFIE